MATRKTASSTIDVPAAPADAVQTVRDRARRKSIPRAGIEAQGCLGAAPRVRHCLEVELLALQIHERVSTRATLGVLARDGLVRPLHGS